MSLENQIISLLKIHEQDVNTYREETKLFRASNSYWDRFCDKYEKDLFLITDLIHKSLIARKSELNGININMMVDHTIRAYFDDTCYGISIANPYAVFSYCEAILLKCEDSTQPKYNIIYLDCVGYNDVCRFRSEDELVAELIRLRDFFRIKN